GGGGRRPRTRPPPPRRGGPRRPRRGPRGTSFAGPLLGGVGAGVARARAQVLEAQPVHQGVDGVEAAPGAELLPEDAPHILASEGAGAVGLRRARAGAPPEGLPLPGAGRP